MSVDERAIVAANNNADIYEAMFKSQGLGFERPAYAFVGRNKPPPYYSNLTVLSPDRTDEVLLLLSGLAEQFDGEIGLKDSFCQLELQGNGFSVLFEASWIWRAPRNISSSPSDWQLIEKPDDLECWEEAWKYLGSPTQNRMFNETMLKMPGIYFFGQKRNGRFEAGCIGNKSAGCIGISNVFSRSPSSRVYADAAAIIAKIDGSLPVVGYGRSGKNLEDALHAGFEAVGDLRILVAKAAAF